MQGVKFREFQAAMQARNFSLEQMMFEFQRMNMVRECSLRV